MIALIQKTRTRTLHFEIDDAGLLKKTIVKSGESEIHTPFEKITTNKSYVVEQNKISLVIGFLLLVVSIAVFITGFYDKNVERGAAAIWLLISAIAFYMYFKTRERKIFLITAENKLIEFYSDKPTPEAVSEFTNELIKKRNTYLNSKYGQPQKMLEYTPQLDNFNWLLNVRAISKLEYDEKVATLNAIFNNAAGNKIGF
jgi:hypothetical protein